MWPIEDKFFCMKIQNYRIIKSIIISYFQMSCFGGNVRGFLLATAERLNLQTEVKGCYAGKGQWVLCRQRSMGAMQTKVKGCYADGNQTVLCIAIELCRIVL